MRNLYHTYLPFLKVKLRDFFGLNFILAQQTNSFRSTITDSMTVFFLVRSVTSSMNALIGDLTFAWSFPNRVDNRMISMTRINQITEMVHPAAMPTSRECHSVVKFDVVNRILKLE